MSTIATTAFLHGINEDSSCQNTEAMLHRHSVVVSRYVQRRPDMSGYKVESRQDGTLLSVVELLTSDALLDLVVDHLQLSGEPCFRSSVEETPLTAKSRLRSLLRAQITVLPHPLSDIVELQYQGKIAACSPKILNTIRSCYLQKTDQRHYIPPPLLSRSLSNQVVLWTLQRRSSTS